MPGSWKGSDRAKRLPPNWEALRRSVLERDGYRCVLCGAIAKDVDHIRRGDDHHPHNLQSLCRPHHKAKTAAEGNAARWAGAKRTAEPHPGLKT